MNKFNAQQVADFINAQQYTQFEFQVRGMVSAHFGCTATTAARWVQRTIAAGLVPAGGPR